MIFLIICLNAHFFHKESFLSVDELSMISMQRCLTCFTHLSYLSQKNCFHNHSFFLLCCCLVVCYIKKILQQLLVCVLGVPAAERDEVKSKTVMEGESVTLDTHVLKNPNDLIAWYFNDILISEINGHLRYICIEAQCNEGTERFRDRLKLDHQTGSLTITNTRTTDSGEYHLEIISSTISIIRIFSVTVTGEHHLL